MLNKNSDKIEDRFGIPTFNYQAEYFLDNVRSNCVIDSISHKKLRVKFAFNAVVGSKIEFLLHVFPDHAPLWFKAEVIKNIQDHSILNINDITSRNRALLDYFIDRFNSH